MPQPQSAICAEGENFAIFLTLMLSDGPVAVATVRQVAAALPALTSAIAAQWGEATLGSAIGFGPAVWPRLFDGAPPDDLVPFERLADGPHEAPATPADLFIHVHSARHDVNFALAREVMSRLGGAVSLVEEVHGFKNQGGRDLTGFVDGTENPKDDERPEAALVVEGEFAGGSYVSIQRYVHALDRWSHLAVSEQEAVIGRTKPDDQELADDVKPPTAHIARVVIEEDGEELKILRHSLPYGTTSEHGLYFVAYGRSPGPFRQMLERMILRDKNGDYDRLLDFSRAVTGAAFFVPSVELLSRLAEVHALGVEA
jgi:putative iron-dependent peroxidase